MASSRSRTVVAVSLLERYLRMSVFIGLRAMLFTGSVFVLYVVGGIVFTSIGWFDPPYPFLSLEADPIFLIGGAIAGLFIVQSAGSLLLYHFLVGFERENSQFSVLMGFVSLGFGGALLRVTLAPALHLLVDMLRAFIV